MRPVHWLDFAPFEMAHTPSKMTIKEARSETDYAWQRSYSPERNAKALEAIKDEPIEYRISHLVSRLFFRGIYFPQMNKRAWLKLLYDNRQSIGGLAKEGIGTWRRFRKRTRNLPESAPVSIKTETQNAFDDA